MELQYDESSNAKHQVKSIWGSFILGGAERKKTTGYPTGPTGREIGRSSPNGSNLLWSSRLLIMKLFNLIKGYKYSPIPTGTNMTLEVPFFER